MSLKNNLNDWYPILEPILTSDKFKTLGKFLSQEYKRKKIYPEGEDIFRAFSLCPYKDLKIVIIGQDPYHNGMANGLAFANELRTLSISPSLNNIRKELEDDYDTLIVDFDITLESWAKQGILLINTALTVPKGEPGAHAEYWKDVTASIINIIATKANNPLVFILWGKHAQGFIPTILQNDSPHEILMAAHPSPYSANNGFFGCKHFSKANQILLQNGRGQIKWFSHQGESAI